MRKIEVIYYSNGQGGTAISVDEGEHVIIANGRWLLASETTWEEEGEDDCGPLSEAQKKAIEEAQAELDAMSEAEGELSDIVLAFRKRRMLAESHNPAQSPEKPKRKLNPSVMIEYSDLED
jgi:hypothetical protein